MRTTSTLILLIITAIAFSQPTSRSAFFVANEGQWPGEFAFRYDGGGGSWFVTKNGLTIDLKQYQVSPQNGLPFGGTEGGYSNLDPFGEREPEPRLVKGHVLKVNLVNAYAYLTGVAAHGSANEILDAPLPQTTVGVQNNNLGLSAAQGLSERGSLPPFPVGAPHAAPATDLSFRKSTQSSQVDYLESRQKIIGVDKLTSYSNYFLGQDKTKWRSRVGHYRKVVAQDVWPGIDVEYCAEPQGVEMVFRVQPGADIDQIQVAYEGLDAPLSVDSKGNLVLKTSLGNLIEQAPFAYQIEHRRQREVPVHYETTDNSYRFVADNYDHTRELVIDPLLYGSLFPAGIEDMALDSQDNKVRIGSTIHPEHFPTTPGAYQETADHVASTVTKLAPDGRTIVFSTFFPNYVQKCCFNSDNSIWLIGSAFDSWPLTSDAFDSTLQEDECGIAKISSDGTTLLFSSYLGGSEDDWCGYCDVDEHNNLYVTGKTRSPDFPTTQDALFPTYAELEVGFITIIEPANHTIAYSTFYLNENLYNFVSRPRIYVIEPYHIWINGSTRSGGLPITADAMYPDYEGDGSSFFARLNLQTSQIEYATYFDGTNQITPLDSNHILIGGVATIPRFTLPPGGFQVEPPDGDPEIYVLELELPATILSGTFLGHTESSEEFSCMIYDSINSAIVISGITNGPDYPVTPGAYDTVYNPGPLGDDFDVVVSKLSADLNMLEYSTYLGHNRLDWNPNLVHGEEGSVWIGGETASMAFPITEDAMFAEWPTGIFTQGFIVNMLLEPETGVNMSPITIPTELSLRAYPNPFNPSTTISFSLPRQAQTSLEVFNVLGQAVYSIDLGQLPAGEYHHRLDAASLPSGTYLTRLNAGEMQAVQKMALVR